MSNILVLFGTHSIPLCLLLSATALFVVAGTVVDAGAADEEDEDEDEDVAYDDELEEDEAGAGGAGRDDLLHDFSWFVIAAPMQ